MAAEWKAMATAPATAVSFMNRVSANRIKRARLHGRSRVVTTRTDLVTILTPRPREAQTRAPSVHAKEAPVISLAQLWLPVVLAAVLIFVASSLIHMVFKWHNSEYRPLSNEEAVRAAIRAGTPAPGQYAVPHVADMKDMKLPQVQQKFSEGPVAFLTVRPNGAISMGKPLVLWF